MKLSLSIEEFTLNCLYITIILKEEPVVYCSVTDLIGCVGEIEAAWDKCSAAGSVDDVLECIQTVLGASDCINCVCDVTGLCKKVRYNNIRTSFDLC